MAKAPRPGLVKTRLATALGQEESAALQAALLIRTVAVATSVSPRGTFVAFEPSDAEGELASLLPRAVTLFPQSGGHLGERMDAATAEVYARLPGPVVVIGADIPLLEGHHLRAALSALAAPDTVVLGPAFDGGYYLLGTTCPRACLFDISPGLWGGPQVLVATAARIGDCGLRVHLLDTLRDLDTVQDAEALLGESRLTPVLRRLLCTALLPLLRRDVWRA